MKTSVYKIAQTIKMWWMFSWRSLLISWLFLRGGSGGTLLLVASVVTPIVLVFVLRKSIQIFPVWRLLTRDQVVFDVEQGPKPQETLHEKHERERKEAAARAQEDRGREIAERHRKEEEKARRWVQQLVPGRKYERGVFSDVPELLVRADGSTFDYYRRTVSDTVILSATRDGLTTGYEPSTLKRQSTSISFTSGKMHGRPGQGLEYATNLDEKRRALGVRGERNFAQALGMNGLLNRFHTVWSVPVPSESRDALGHLQVGRFDTDIDCVIAAGDALYLVDLKNYASGDVIYFNEGDELYCQDASTGHSVGDPRKMSRNMEMATNIILEVFPAPFDVRPCVVFMPTDKGEGGIEGVYWPGRIQALNLTDFLAHLGEQDSGVENSKSIEAALELAKLAEEQRRKKYWERNKDKSVHDQLMESLRFDTLLD